MLSDETKTCGQLAQDCYTLIPWLGSETATLTDYDILHKIQGQIPCHDNLDDIQRNQRQLIKNQAAVVPAETQRS